MSDDSTRRQYLLTLSAMGVGGLAGCSESDIPLPQAETDASSTDLGGANFAFEYAAEQQQLTIQFNGGAAIAGGDLQIRAATTETRTLWSELGSTIADTDQQLDSGATAVLGPEIINWNQQVGRGETIRLVFVGQDTPATLGRFTPPESGTLTATVPSTPAATATETDTPTPTPTPTETPVDDTTPPSIDAFGLSNPSAQSLRVSFDSDEQLSLVEVTLGGPEEATLTTADFTESDIGETYSYEATYDASTDGTYSATLDGAVDASGNDGAGGQSADVVVDTDTPSGDTSLDGFEDGSLSEWGSIEAAETTTETAYAGERSLAVTDMNESGDRIGSEVTRSFDTISPSTLSGALRIDSGAYNTVQAKWRDDSGTTVHRVQIRNYDDQIEYDRPTALASTTPNTWYSFELADIDWENEQIGEIRIDGSVADTDVEFLNSASEVTSVELKVHDGGTGSVGHFDDITVGPTDDTPNDTTPPSVSAFSLANPLNRSLRTSFDSTEQLSAIEVDITGGVETTLETAAFSETATDDGTYTYEATYAAGADGTFTATLVQAADGAGNDGASDESVTVTIDTSSTGGPTVVDDFEDTGSVDWTIDRGDSSRLEFASEAPQGDHSLHFLQDSEDTSTDISTTLAEPLTFTSFGIWFRYESANDNNFRIILRDSGGDKVFEFREFFGQMHYRDPELSGSSVPHTGIAQVNQNQWYHLVLENVDFSTHTFDALVYDDADNLVDSAEGVGFWNERDDVETVEIKNGLGNNGNPDPLWVDYVTYTE